MRRVLVVSPHFPPTDTVDMHRVRTTVGHYRENGWEPTVLCVRPELTGRPVEPTLAGAAPEDVARVETGAAPLSVAGRLGLSAIGLRAWPAMKAAGDRLLATGAFDLVFISTTAFPLMSLGRVWKQRFGVPFVLDFQDPWATFPKSAEPYVRTGLKHRAMQALHRRLEAWTVPEADGLMAVSAEYLDILLAAYASLATCPTIVSPFGYSQEDFAVADARGVAPFPRRSAEQVSWYFGGRIAPAMESSVSTLFSIVRAGRDGAAPALDPVRMQFVGTGYKPRDNPPVAANLAAQAGLADVVEERPDRVPLMDALKGSLDADVLMVFGSETGGYIPSKLNQCLALPKPVICVAPAGSPLEAAAADQDGVLFIPTGTTGEGSRRKAAKALAQLTTGQVDLTRRIQAARRYDAAASAARDCGFFSQVVARRDIPRPFPATKVACA